MFRVYYYVQFWSETEEDWKWEENKGEVFSSENKEEAETFIQNAMERFDSGYIKNVTKWGKCKNYSLTDRRLLLGSDKHIWNLIEDPDKIINATPHAVTIMDAENNVIQTLEPSGICPRCSVSRETVDSINGIPVNRSMFGDVVGLPDYKEGTIYIVSRVVAEAAKRHDLYIVDDAVRDEAGRIIGCRALATIQ